MTPQLELSICDPNLGINTSLSSNLYKFSYEWNQYTNWDDIPSSFSTQEEIIDSFGWNIFDNITLSTIDFFNIVNINKTKLESLEIDYKSFDEYEGSVFVLSFTVIVDDGSAESNSVSLFDGCSREFTLKKRLSFFLSSLMFLFVTFVQVLLGVHIEPKVVETPDEIVAEIYTFEIVYNANVEGNRSTNINSNGTRYVINYSDIDIDLTDIIKFPFNNTNSITNRYDFETKCFRIPTESIVTGSQMEGYSFETIYYDSEICKNGLLNLNDNSTILRLEGNLIEDNSIYNLTVIIKDTLFEYISAGYAYISAIVSDSSQVQAYINVIGNRRFNSDSRIILQVITIPNLESNNWNNDSVSYIWYEKSGKLSVYDLDFITVYQNYLVIDGSNDKDGILIENEEYIFEVFIFSEL